MRIRDAEESDVDGILAIHNDAIENTTAIWDTAPVDHANRLAWLRDRTMIQGFPVIVAARDDRVVGYGSFGEFRPWSGYGRTVEHSVYVHSDHRGRGVGKVLLGTLIDRARSLGKHVMVGAIESGNMQSIRLHESFGFERVAHLRQVGSKFGRWLDLVFMQRMLDE